MLRAVVKAWRAAMKWFVVVHHGYLGKRHPNDDDMTLEEKGTESEKLSTTA